MEELDTLIESPRAYERRGNRALSRRDWVAAAGHFRRGLVLEPADPTLRHRLGTVLFQMGDPGGAFTEFERILQTAPDFALAHFSLGVLLEGRGPPSGGDRAPRGGRAARAGLRRGAARAGRPPAPGGPLRGSAAAVRAGHGRGRPGRPADRGSALRSCRHARHASAATPTRGTGSARGWRPTRISPSSSTPWRVSSAAQPIRGSGTAPVRSSSWRRSRRPPARSIWASRWPWPWRQRGVSARRRAGSGTPSTGPARGGRADLVPGMREKLTRYERGLPWRSDDPVEFDPFLERSAGAIR